jgi:hypothetical protein
VDYEDHGYAPLLFEALDQVEDKRALLGPHRRERLVEEEHLRVGVDGPGDGYGLALAAGEPGDHGVYGRYAHAHVLEVAGRLLLHLAVVQEGADGKLAVQEHVVEDGQFVDEGEVLVDGLDAKGSGLGDGAEVHLLALYEEPAPVGAVEARDRLEQRALAGAVVPDQAEHLAPLDVHVHALEYLDGPESLDEVLGAQEVPTRGRAVGGAVASVPHQTLPEPRRRAM